ncbi:transposase [Salicibibacter cibarius]|uniref:transposase n=1 Tax=Salicibibacter cibarius TaxID=2743000 RepID=UPI001FE467E5|nr:transposase [Salicibibacter cibarius]
MSQGFRIPIAEDRRVFSPIDRASYTWKKAYAKRPSVERVNSRLDGSFGFEQHTTRGKRKMRMKTGLVLCMMLATALGHIQEGCPEKMRSLVS